MTAQDVEQLIAENKRLHAELNIMRSRERDDYFKGCATVLEIKPRYLQYAQEFNFERGGDEQTIQRINDQYEKACDPIIMYSATSEENMFAQFERMARYVEIISLLQVLVGIKVEILGVDLWVTCTVYQSEHAVRAAGLKFSPSKQAWCYPL